MQRTATMEPRRWWGRFWPLRSPPALGPSDSAAEATASGLLRGRALIAAQLLLEQLVHVVVLLVAIVVEDEVPFAALVVAIARPQ